MYRKRIAILLFTATMLTALPYAALPVSASSVGDVIAHARALGMPESEVQSYIAMGSGREWTSAQCDQAIAILDSMAGQWQKNDSSSSSDEAEAIEPEEFVQMESPERKEYVTKVSEEEQQIYLELMDDNEKKDLLLEANPDKQEKLAAGMLDLDKPNDYHLEVQEMTDGVTLIQAKDEKLQLVSETAIGSIVEQTGIPYTAPILAASGMILGSVAGMILILKRSK